MGRCGLAWVAISTAFGAIRAKDWSPWDGMGRGCGGPGRIRTYDQGIHVLPMFPSSVDYLFTLGRCSRVGAGCSLPVIKGTEALR